MSEPVSIPAPKSASSSFASLLASFTGSPNKPSQAWDDSALADDVAILSYEQALRSQRRVPPSAALPENEARPLAAPPTPQTLPIVADKRRKTSSITIRLTEVEQAQLHERATAAQLSVSAYLRSCIFEAESLRAQVKKALSEMKAATAPDPQVSREPQSAHNWRTRLLPHWTRPRASA
ncbi:MAG: hypothetical protein WB561_07670 [Terracidiphilus sp.]